MKQLPIIEHSYSKESHGLATGSAHGTSKPGHTTLSVKGSHDSEIVLNTEVDPNESTCSIGASVMLLTLSYEEIGSAVTMSGEHIHGQDIPDGYIKVAINWINAGIHPLVGGIDEELTAGCITAWPKKFTRRI